MAAAALAAVRGKCPAVVRASELMPFTVTSTGSKRADALLGGGARAGWLTEIAGEAGAGKTQLIMQLAIQTSLPVAIGGRGRHAVIINTEGSFPVRRMRTMAFAVWAGMGAGERAACEAAGMSRDDLWSHHLVLDAHGADDLERACRGVISAARRPGHGGRVAGAVLIDSVAAPFRVRDPDEAGGAAKAASTERRWYGVRARALLGMAGRLRELAEECGVPVVVTNQATAVVAGDDAAFEDAAPALGMAWAHAAHVRVILRRRRAVADARRRMLQLVFHPAAAPGACECVLGERGLRDAGED